MDKLQMNKLQFFLIIILLVNLWSLYMNYSLYKSINNIEPIRIVEHKIVVVKQMPAIQEEIVKVEPPEILKTEEELILDYVDAVCVFYPNVDPAIVKSVISHESNFDPNAVNGRCIGLMQISTRWHGDRAERLGVTDFYDPYGNILIGVDYLSELISKNKNISLALMLYNMKHADAYQMFNNGKISIYAKSVLAESDFYRKGE